MLTVVAMLAPSWLFCMQSQLHGMLPVVDSHFGQLQQTSVHWSTPLKQACAVCHSLTLESRVVVGDEVEQQLFKMVEAYYKVCHVHSFALLVLSAAQQSHRPKNLMTLLRSESSNQPRLWSTQVGS